MIALVVIFLIMGLIYVISPETGRRMKVSRKYQDTEPSDFELACIRVIGAVMLIVAAVVAVKIFSGN